MAPDLMAYRRNNGATTDSNNPTDAARHSSSRDAYVSLLMNHDLTVLISCRPREQNAMTDAAIEIVGDRALQVIGAQGRPVAKVI